MSPDHNRQHELDCGSLATAYRDYIAFETEFEKTLGAPGHTLTKMSFNEFSSYVTTLPLPGREYLLEKWREGFPQSFARCRQELDDGLHWSEWRISKQEVKSLREKVAESIAALTQIALLEQQREN